MTVLGTPRPHPTATQQKMLWLAAAAKRRLSAETVSLWRFHLAAILHATAAHQSGCTGGESRRRWEGKAIGNARRRCSSRAAPAGTHKHPLSGATEIQDQRSAKGSRVFLVSQQQAVTVPVPVLTGCPLTRSIEALSCSNAGLFGSSKHVALPLPPQPQRVN